MASSIEASSGSGDGDPWGPDTIADGSPVVPHSIEPAARMPSAKSLLVDIDREKPSTGKVRKHPTTDVTAEDSEEDSEASMSSSDESSPR